LSQNIRKKIGPGRALKVAYLKIYPKNDFGDQIGDRLSCYSLRLILHDLQNSDAGADLSAENCHIYSPLKVGFTLTVFRAKNSFR
jgi:hypothetical protein